MSNTVAATEGAPPCLILDDGEMPASTPAQTGIWRRPKEELHAAHVFGSKGGFPPAFQSYGPGARGGAARGRGRGGARTFPFQPKRAVATVTGAAAPAPLFLDDDDPPYAPCTPPPEQQ